MGRMVRSSTRAGSAGLLALVVVLSADGVGAQAARVGSVTSHGGAVIQGSTNVLIGGAPAARVGDQVSCPLACGGAVPHVGGPIASGSATVLINGRAAARVGSVVSETCATSAIASGLATVSIGP